MNTTQHKNQDDSRGAYLPSQFRIKVEAARIRKYGAGPNILKWTKFETLRRKQCSGTELAFIRSVMEEHVTIPVIDSDFYQVA